MSAYIFKMKQINVWRKKQNTKVVRSIVLQVWTENAQDKDVKQMLKKKLSGACNWINVIQSGRQKSLMVLLY